MASGEWPGTLREYRSAVVLGRRGGCQLLPAALRLPWRDDDRADGPLQDALGDASEQAGGELPAARAAQHDEVGVPLPGLGQDALGDPVHHGVAHAAARGQAGHAELKDRGVGHERSIAAALPGVPAVAGELALAQMQRPYLRGVGGHVLHQFQRVLAVVEVLNRYQDLGEHPRHAAFVGVPPGRCGISPGSPRRNPARPAGAHGFRMDFADQRAALTNSMSACPASRRRTVPVTVPSITRRTPLSAESSMTTTRTPRTRATRAIVRPALRVAAIWPSAAQPLRSSWLIALLTLAYCSSRSRRVGSRPGLGSPKVEP